LARYCTEDDVRKILNLKTDRADDEELRYWIDEAQLDLVRDISVEILDEVADGNINGSNTTFSVDNYPIADTDYNSSINGSDINVFLWGDSEEPSTKTEATVSTVYPQYGSIVLSTAPASTWDQITVDYRYYTNTINFTLAKYATRALAGYKFVLAKYLLIPERLAHGPVRYSFGRPSKKLYDEYLRVLNLMLTKPFLTQKAESTKLLREDI